MWSFILGQENRRRAGRQAMLLRACMLILVALAEMSLALVLPLSPATTRKLALHPRLRSQTCRKPRGFVWQGSLRMTSVEPEKASVETQIYPDFAFDFESGASFPLDAKVMTAKKMFQILRKESDEHTSLILQKLLDKHIYSRRSLTEAISSLLAAKVCSSDLDEQDLYEVFLKVLRKHRNVVACMVQDLVSQRATAFSYLHSNGNTDVGLQEWCKEIDPATIFYLQPFLFFKGFHAVQLQRMSHALWTEGDEGDKMLALALQVPSKKANRLTFPVSSSAVLVLN